MIDKGGYPIKLSYGSGRCLGKTISEINGPTWNRVSKSEHVPIFLYQQFGTTTSGPGIKQTPKNGGHFRFQILASNAFHTMWDQFACHQSLLTPIEFPQNLRAS